MLAMQYEITLPADYDMGIIRRRVERGGPILDAYPGLGLKAFLAREKGVGGSPVNQYAPFYLWEDSAAAASFLWAGDGFGNIVRDFGRPAVQTWIGGAFRRGPAYGTTPSHAVRTPRLLDRDADPTEAAAATADALAARESEPGLHSIAYGIDPQSWEFVLFALHIERPAAVDGDLFQVLHLSAPGIDRLPGEVRRRL
ncbi:DUF4865 family protein [Naasia aerilata]|uniref:DUF4865 domain-containing protein n=1 Tax=Naasia aerilata TaxID=1162966 RepID=A0ABM8G822_9MICO|nr:DUF4865 family protein [Naasia aerilata]BDZ44325.1 DUF4865 domain-containing protein [Naasia aerilata]